MKPTADLSPHLAVDWDGARKRQADLEHYLQAEVDDGSALTCRSATGCRASVKLGHLAVGQLSHVGAAYSLQDRGRPLRILIVPMQTGRDDQHVTMGQRSEQVDSAKPTSARPMPRTRHMDGTALAIKVLLGLDPLAADELKPGLHVFDCFAMANTTLCSRLVPGKGSAGEGTTTMRDACQRHLERTIAILEPTVIVAQGVAGPTASVAASIGVPARPRSSTSIRIGDRTVGVALLSHPSREWPRPGYPVFQGEVAPALRKARAAALGEATTP